MEGTVKVELENWNEFYRQALNGENLDNLNNSIWWNMADNDVIEYVAPLFSKNKKISIFEPGSGPGITSFKLSIVQPVSHLTLLDLSSYGLELAKKDEKKYTIDSVAYIQGDFLETNSISEKFDLVWNIGVLEHYKKHQAEAFIKKMYDFTKNKGYLVIGIPNRNSLPVLKASLLGSKFGNKFLKSLPGYRNTTEILYSNAKMSHLIQTATSRKPKIYFCGSSSFVGSPDTLTRSMKKFFPNTRFSFLTIFIVQK